MKSHPAQADLHRFALALEYNGLTFSGWQRQRSSELTTVQAELELALSSVADRPVTAVCAGRTDAGVHASCQIVHFDCEIDRGDKAWTLGINSLLPANIRVLWSKPVGQEFHARFSATARRYVYVIYSAKIGSALLVGQLCHLHHDLDVCRMQKAAEFLVGEQDFSAFRAAGCQSRSPFRNVFEASVYQSGAYCIFDIRANAFLQHMVRNISGALISIGKGDRDPEWIEELINTKDRTRAGVTAPPNGLYLMQVDYPPHFELPLTSRLPLLLGSSDVASERTD